MTEHPQAEILRAIASGHQDFEIIRSDDWIGASGTDALVSILVGNPVRIKPREAAEQHAKALIAINKGDV